MRPRKPAAHKKVNEQTQRLQELVDSCDTEHRSELNVDQIGKSLQLSATVRSPRMS